MCMCAFVLSCVWFFVTLCTEGRHTSMSVEFSRQEYWNESPFPPPRDLPDPGIEPSSLISPLLAGEFLTTSATWEDPYEAPRPSICQRSYKPSKFNQRKYRFLSIYWSLDRAFKAVFCPVPCERALSCVWLFANPWTEAHQTPQSMGFPREEYLSRLPFSSPGYLPNPEIETVSLASNFREKKISGLWKWWIIKSP